MTSAVVERSFENFREPRSPGLGGLGKWGTLLLIGAAVIGIVLTINVNLITGGVWGVLAGAVLLAIARRDRHGLSVLERTGARAAHGRAVRRGTAVYRSGPLTRLGKYRLPGVLADTELTEHEDTTGSPFALVHTPRPNHYAVTIECHPDGASLLDAADTAENVDRWGEFLSFLAFEPGLVQAMVTIESGPDDGTGLRAEAEARASTDAPALAGQVMQEILGSYPAGSAAVRSFVTLTFTAVDGKRARTAEQMGSTLAHRLPPIVSRLSGTGAGQAIPLDGQGLCRLVRIAYDPAATRLLSGNNPTVLLWSGVGPVTADAREWTHYRHSAAVSRSWSMTDIMGRVHALGLGPLLHPHGNWRKRVSLILTPHDPGRSQRIAAADVKAAEYRVMSTRKPSAADRRDLAAAEATAAEEAHGNALIDVAVIVTVTVGSPEELPAVDAALDSLGPAARLLLRPEDGGHAQAFAQSLPGVGLVAAAHSLTPRWLREEL